MDELWQQQIRERALLIWQREGSPAGSPDQFSVMAEQELLAEGRTPSRGPLDEQPDRPREEVQIDEAIDDSFPASDPPAWTSETGAGAPKGAKSPKPF